MKTNVVPASPYRHIGQMKPGTYVWVADLDPADRDYAIVISKEWEPEDIPLTGRVRLLRGEVEIALTDLKSLIIGYYKLGKKIDAIKLVRQYHAHEPLGPDLKQAKQWVEDLVEQYQ